MGLGFILICALVTLAIAWAINAFMGAISGEQTGGLLSTWWDMLGNLARRPTAYADPLPEGLRPKRFHAGDYVRIPLLPLELERELTEERRQLFRRRVGKILRVESVDEFGVIELHVLDDGSQSPDPLHHVLFLEPQYAEPAGDGR